MHGACCGGTLGGTGTIGNTQVNSGGTLAPGSGAPGTSLTIHGNLAFQSGALYLVQVNSTTASLANVTGTASLAGTVQANIASATNKSYDILHSAGLGGTRFNALVFTNPNFSGSLSYTGTDVFLTPTANLGAGSNLNQNQQNVAGAINNFFNNGGALRPARSGWLATRRERRPRTRSRNSRLRHEWRNQPRAETSAQSDLVDLIGSLISQVGNLDNIALR
jgi:hypothetical protein